MTDAPAERKAAQSPLRTALADDAAWWAYRWVFRPLLVFQLALYLRGVARYVANREFLVVGGAADPLLHENHIGNYSILAGQPNPILVGIHLAMATFWIGAVLFQKHAVTRMALGLNSAVRDRSMFLRYRRVHAVVGTAICAVAFAGCVAGPLIAWQSHGHPPMRTFLLLLPLFFLPAITTVWLTGRRGGAAIRDHQAWANIAFLGPAVASLWAEALIYFFGRETPLGPRRGELLGTGLAWALVLLAIVIPVLRRKHALKGRETDSVREAEGRVVSR